MQSKKTYPWPPSYRLKESWEFDRVFRTNKRFNGRMVRLFCSFYGQGQSRFGFAVGKKIAAATGRARGRRVLRECARRLYSSTKPGWFIVLMMTPAGLSAQSTDLYREIVHLLEKANLLADVPPAFDDGC